MPANVTVVAVDSTVVIGFEDGAVIQVPAGTEQFFQVPNEDWVTISAGEGTPPDPATIGDVWRKVWQMIRQEIAEEVGVEPSHPIVLPEPTPHDK